MNNFLTKLIKIIYTIHQKFKMTYTLTPCLFIDIKKLKRPYDYDYPYNIYYDDFDYTCDSMSSHKKLISLIIVTIITLSIPIVVLAYIIT